MQRILFLQTDVLVYRLEGSDLHFVVDMKESSYYLVKHIKIAIFQYHSIIFDKNMHKTNNTLRELEHAKTT